MTFNRFRNFPFTLFFNKGFWELGSQKVLGFVRSTCYIFRGDYCGIVCVCLCVLNQLCILGEKCHWNIVCEISSRSKGMFCGCNSCWDDILNMPGQGWQGMTGGLGLKEYTKLSRGLGWDRESTGRVTNILLWKQKLLGLQHVLESYITALYSWNASCIGWGWVLRMSFLGGIDIV